MEKLGREFADTRDTNPGEVWEENEFWFELSWRIDPDGSLGIRQYFESPYRPGEQVTVDEYYRWVFENRVPGLPEKAAAEGLDPAGLHAQVRRRRDRQGPLPPGRAAADRRGARRCASRTSAACSRKPTDDELDAAAGRRGGLGRRPAGGRVDASPGGCRRRASSSCTPRRWRRSGWPEHATPGYIRSHVAHDEIEPRPGRDGADSDLPAADPDPHPVRQREVPQRDQQHPPALDARLGRRRQGRGDRRPGARPTPRSATSSRGVWVTQAHPPGRRRAEPPHGPLAAARQRRQPLGDRQGRHQPHRAGHVAAAVRRAASGRSRAATRTPTRITWDDPGVHQNLAFPVQPDPWSGMHCWLQKVTVTAAHPERPVRRRRGRHRQGARGRAPLDGADQAGTERRRLAPPGVLHAPGQAEAQDVQGLRRLTVRVQGAQPTASHQKRATNAPGCSAHVVQARLIAASSSRSASPAATARSTAAGWTNRDAVKLPKSRTS